MYTEYQYLHKEYEVQYRRREIYRHNYYQAQARAANLEKTFGILWDKALESRQRLEDKEAEQQVARRETAALRIQAGCLKYEARRLRRERDDLDQRLDNVWNDYLVLEDSFARLEEDNQVQLTTIDNQVAEISRLTDQVHRLQGHSTSELLPHQEPGTPGRSPSPEPQ